MTLTCPQTWQLLTSWLKVTAGALYNESQNYKLLRHTVLCTERTRNYCNQSLSPAHPATECGAEQCNKGFCIWLFCLRVHTLGSRLL